MLPVAAGGSQTAYVGKLFEVEIGASATISRSIDYAGLQRVAMRVVSATQDVVYYLHADLLGSTSLVTAEDGAVAGRQLYTPFGESRWREGTLTGKAAWREKRTMI